jgi:hypothetical protein
MCPRPHRGQGWRKGGNNYPEGSFLQSSFLKIFTRPCCRDGSSAPARPPSGSSGWKTGRKPSEGSRGNEGNFSPSAVGGRAGAIRFFRTGPAGPDHIQCRSMPPRSGELSPAQTYPERCRARVICGLPYPYDPLQCPGPCTARHPIIMLIQPCNETSGKYYHALHGLCPVLRAA